MDRHVLAGIFLVIIGAIGVAKRTEHAQAQRTWLKFWGFRALEEEDYALFYGILGSIIATLGAAVLLYQLLV